MDGSLLPDFVADFTEPACKAVGKLSEVFYLKEWERKEKRKDVLQDAQNEVDAQKIKDNKAMYKDGEFVELTNLMDTVEKNGQDDAQKIKENEVMDKDNKLLKFSKLLNTVEQNNKLKSMQNQFDIFYVAFEELKKLKDYDKVSSDPLSIDWFRRWREQARFISEEYLRLLWARILRDEIKQSGNISYRAMDVLKNLSSSEVKLFEKILRYRIGGIIISEDVRTNASSILTCADALLLVDAGLLSGIENIGFVPHVNDSGKVLFEANGCDLEIDPCTYRGKESVLNGFALSRVGCELVNVPNIEPIDVGVLKYFAESIHKFRRDVHPRITAYDKSGKVICAYDGSGL